MGQNIAGKMAELEAPFIGLEMQWRVGEGRWSAGKVEINSDNFEG
jgi:hypothetical protein